MKTQYSFIESTAQYSSLVSVRVASHRCLRLRRDLSRESISPAWCEFRFQAGENDRVYIWTLMISWLKTEKERDPVTIDDKADKDTKTLSPLSLKEIF